MMLGKRKNIILALLLGYLVALAVSSRFTDHEVFPIFEWSLFKRTPHIKGSAELRILEIDHQVQNPPLDFMEEAHDITAYMLIQKLAVAQSSGQFTAVESLRETLETKFMGKWGHAKYQIIYVMFDPLVRQRTGQVMQHRSLAIWEKKH